MRKPSRERDARQRRAYHSERKAGVKKNAPKPVHGYGKENAAIARKRAKGR